MIVLFCFCVKDQDQALRSARWWNDLGGCKGHELLVCYDPRCNPVLVEELRVEMEKSFDKLWRINEVAQVDDWPQGANYFFKLCCTWLQYKPQWPSFLWMEPDAIPLSPGWLDAIAGEYARAGKPFMGDRVEVQVNGKDVPLHMSGVGVYENPIYLKAGEAYRAYDMAWDMAARNQIIPHAHFTRLIEHAWQHPTFKDKSELATQVRPEAVIFHSSKDGSLIELLRQKRGGNHVGASSMGIQQPTIKEPDTQPGSPSPLSCDIFIRTYPGDYQWLKYCLLAINKFAKGFRKIWIVSTQEAPFDVGPLGYEWRQMNDETEDGYLAQQISKCYADVITDYQAEYILHVDSDVIFTTPVTPEYFFTGEKMTWYCTPYEEVHTPWQPITEKFIGLPVPYEFMRRLPMMIPRWLYPKMREFCYARHGRVISEYIRTQPLREFSEFNALGAYAYMNHPDDFAWVDTHKSVIPGPCAKQFHSWSGLTEEVKTEIDDILRGVPAMVVRIHNAAMTVNGEPTPPQIKVLPSGVWVLEGDQISGWVEQEGRLDHDQNLLPVILKHIHLGDTVIDVGAFIGDHTIAYARQVSELGKVYAFEPNPIAFACLKHNLSSLRHAHLCQTGLSDVSETVPLSGNNGNYGGAYVGTHMKLADVKLERLDDMMLYPDLIKIDAEGYEMKVLSGAEKTISEHHPILVIEINREALRRQGATPDQVFGWLTQHLYGWRIIEENALRNDPLYNIIALPAVDRPGPAQVKAETPTPERIDASASASTPSPQVIKNYITALKEFACASPKNKALVMQHLVYAKLRKPNKKAHRKRKRTIKKHTP
jgi:FkbM family methyltransferase